MAGGTRSVTSWPGLSAAIFLAALILGTLTAVWARAESGLRFGVSDWAAIRFTLWQAFLSATISVCLAIPVARALARRNFRGREALILLLGAPFVLPVIVAVLGLLAVFGRAGVISDFLALFGAEPIQIYGLHGVVLAHVFFNLPLATRLILLGWLDIPPERFRLAAQLGFRPRDTFRVIEWPMLQRVLPGAFAAVFAICLTSFAVALTLGGGPKATTVELAIYEAFRFEFDLARAATLGVVQIIMAGTVAVLALGAMRRDGFGLGVKQQVQRWDRPSGVLLWQDRLFIIGATLFLILPLLMVTVRGLGGLTAMTTSIWASVLNAAVVSLAVALATICLTLFFAIPMAVASARWRITEAVALGSISASPLVLGTGLFILMNPWVRPLDWAFQVTALVNAVMALPFVLRVLASPVRDVIKDYGRLSQSLGVTGAMWLRVVLLPRIARPLGFAAGLTGALSMGDLGVVTLFADPEKATLPLQMYRLMGSYQMDAAAGAALILMTLSFGIFWLFDRGGRAIAEA